MKKNILCLGLLLFLPCMAAIAQQADLSQPLPMNPNVKVGKLPNGITYYIQRNKEPQNRMQLRLVVKAGSVLETNAQQGLAHFMEHMNFNGTKHFPKNELVNFLQKSGVRFGADLNAYTSFDETVYELPLPTDSAEVFKKGFVILSDWAARASLNPTEIDKERGVVLEELRLGKGANARMRDKWLPVLLKKSQYANRLPIGKEDILKNFKHEILRDFHRDWYRPDLQAVVAVGDFDVNTVEALINENFGTIAAVKKAKTRKDFQIPLVGGTDVVIVTDKEQPMTMAQVFYKQPQQKEYTIADRRRDIANNLFNQMLSMRLQELSRKSDAPFQYGAASFGGFLGNLDAFTLTAVAKGDDIEKALKSVLDELIRVKKFGYTSSEFERSKKNYWTSREQQYNERDKTDSEDYVSELVNSFLEGTPVTAIDFDYQAEKPLLESIKLEEINALADSFITNENRVVVLTAPEANKDKLPTEANIREWLDNAGKDVTPYKDDVLTKPLLATLPTGTRVVATKQLPEIGVTEWKLANGATVLLKPTDFKNDEIQISAQSLGGTSLYSNADFLSAAAASQLIGSLSGAGEYPQARQLQKLLTGKTVKLRTSISSTQEGISGSTSPKDLETALQLLYARFTQPKQDTDAIKGALNKQKEQLLAQEKTPTPEKTFSDTLTALVGNYAYRMLPMNSARVEKIDADRAFNIYKERFADASNFVFTFVGNFKVEEIQVLIEKYIGGLPATNSNETCKDLGIRSPRGKVGKTVEKGLENKSLVALLISGDYQYSPENNIQTDALEEALKIQLVEKLREEEAGVYSPFAQIEYEKIPNAEYSILIYFGCSPANVEKLVDKTLEVLNKFKATGVEAKDIEKFVAETKREYEKSLKTNSFWLNYLTRKALYNEDMLDITKKESRLKLVTPESTKIAANILFTDNLVRVVLVPEKK